MATKEFAEGSSTSVSERQHNKSSCSQEELQHKKQELLEKVESVSATLAGFAKHTGQQQKEDHKASPAGVPESLASGKRVFHAPREGIVPFKVSTHHRPRNALAVPGSPPRQAQQDRKGARSRPDQVPVATGETDRPVERYSLERFKGIMISIRPAGFGFAHCKNLRAKYDREDMLVHSDACRRLQVGDRISFQVMMSRGRPSACNVVRMIEGGRSRSGSRGGRKAQRSRRRSSSSSSSSSSRSVISRRCARRRDPLPKREQSVRRRSPSRDGKFTRQRSRTRSSGPDRRRRNDKRTASPTVGEGRDSAKGGQKHELEKDGKAQPAAPSNAAPSGSNAFAMKDTPKTDGPVWSFRRWMASQPEHLDCNPEDMVDGYRAYQKEVEKSWATKFFNTYKTHGAVRDRFHPMSLLRAFDDKAAQARRTAMAFADSLCNGRFADIRLEVIDAPDALAQATDDKSILRCTEAAEGKDVHIAMNASPHFGCDVNAHAIKFELPSSISVWALRELVQSLPGLESFSIAPADKEVTCAVVAGAFATEAVAKLPTPESSTVFVRFSSEDALDVALKKLETVGDAVQIDGVSARHSRATTTSTGLIHAVAAEMSKPEQVARDVELAGQLISLLDKRKQIDEKVTDAILGGGADAACKLDLRLLYLRRVHYFCFYKGVAYNDERQFAARCGVACIRRSPAKEDESPSAAPVVRDSVSPPTATEEHDHTARISKLLSDVDDAKPPQPVRSGEAFDARYAAEIKMKMRAAAKGRFGCCLCPKLFKGPEYVEKHIRNNHPAVLAGIHEQLDEEQMRENLLADRAYIKTVIKPPTQGLDEAAGRSPRPPATPQPKAN